VPNSGKRRHEKFMGRELFTLNPGLDRAKLAEAFASEGRVQVRDFLTDQTAEEIHRILSTATPWGLAWQAGDQERPQAIEAPALRKSPEVQRDIASATYAAAASGAYGVQFARYPIVDAYVGKWNEGSPHDLLLEYINAPDFMDFVREVTGIPELVKADAQATLFAPGHFLGRHIDSHVAEGWSVAYVMNFTKEWKPDWGGYLNFFDDDGDIVTGYRPRFNALNMFKVPRAHAVSFLPPFAPVGRFAITGWFRDR
jgi:Rps23 Pro-64 3,4-dihydroxylase Tpa1-like proline 4-hydroxylase